MRRIEIGFGVLVVAILSAATAMAQQSWTASPQMAIAEVENRWLQHLDDPVVLQSILADDFVHVLPSGMITKQQHIDYVKAHPRPPQESRSFENMKVRVYGDTGIANGIVIITGPDGTRRSVFTDVFVKRDGRWQAVNAQEDPEQAQH